MANVLEPRTAELVGIAAAIAGHCQPCFDFHYRKALELGVSLDEIRATVILARSVRAAGDRHMDDHANRRMTACAEPDGAARGEVGGNSSGPTPSGPSTPGAPDSDPEPSSRPSFPGSAVPRPL